MMCESAELRLRSHLVLFALSHPGTAWARRGVVVVAVSEVKQQTNMKTHDVGFVHRYNWAFHPWTPYKAVTINLQLTGRTWPAKPSNPARDWIQK